MARRRTKKASSATEATQKKGSEQAGARFPSTIPEELLKSTASFSFAAPLGSRINIDPSSVTDINSRSVPGIMSIRWIPSVGYADGPTAPVNTAARVLMTRIRQANSGRRNYDQDALMIYILAVDSAHMYLAHMKRLYGLCRLVNPQNRFNPQAIVEACDGDYNDIIRNMADFRSYINTFAMRLFALPVPSIPLIERHQAMSLGLYADSNSPKAQMYTFVPDGYYQYEYDEDTSSGYLQLQDIPSLSSNYDFEVMGVDGLKAFGEQLLEPLLITYGEEDFALIGGDILKAYGEEGVYRATGIGEDFAVLPAYDELMLTRIMNLTAFGFNYLDEVDAPNDGNSSFNVVQNLSQAPVQAWLESKPMTLISENAFKYPHMFAYNKILTSNQGPMSPEVAVEALSFSHIGTIDGGGGEDPYILNLDSVGTEVTTRMFIYYNADDGAGNFQTLHTAQILTVNSFAVTMAGTTPTVAEMLGGIYSSIAFHALVSSFDWHPVIFNQAIVKDSTGADVGGSNIAGYPFGDIGDYTIVSKEDINRIRSIKMLMDFGL